MVQSYGHSDGTVATDDNLVGFAPYHKAFYTVGRKFKLEAIDVGGGETGDHLFHHLTLLMTGCCDRLNETP